MLKKKKKRVHEEIIEDIRKHLETKENGNTALHNLWNAAKAGLRGKFTVIQALLRNQNSQTIQPKRIRKEWTKLKVTRRKDINKDERGYTIEIKKPKGIDR